MSRKKLYELYCHLRTTFKIEHISELELIDKLKQCVNIGMKQKEDTCN